MQVHFGIELLKAEWFSAVACIGTFDGVHLGHQEVIQTAVTLAREHDAPCVLVTFDRHPAHILAPDKCPKAIAGLQTKPAPFRKFGGGAAAVPPPSLGQ